MDETIDTGFEDFEEALFADDFQTDSDENTEEADNTQDNDTREPNQDPEDEPEGGDDSDDEHSSESEEDAAEDEDKPDSGKDDGKEQLYTLKVNKKEEQVTLEKMTDLARQMAALNQQGLDFQQIKEHNQQIQQLRQANTELQSRLDGMASHQEALDILSLLAERTGSSIGDLAKTLYRNFRKTAGISEDAANLELENAQLKKQAEAAQTKADEDQQQDQEADEEDRVQRDLEEFRQENPDVELTKELLDKLAPDIENGMSLAAAFRKMERAEEKARLAEMERKLAAANQNAKNKRNTPGSQKDVGGRRAKSDEELFEQALFG